MPLDSYLHKRPSPKKESTLASTKQLPEIKNLRASTEALTDECGGIYKALGINEVPSSFVDTQRRFGSSALFEDPSIIERIDTAGTDTLSQIEAGVIAETRLALRSLYKSRQQITDLLTEQNLAEQDRAAKSLVEGFKRLAELRSTKTEHTFYPRIGFPADGGAIEGQWVEVLDIETDHQTHPKYQVNFKLTERYLQELLRKIEDGALPSGASQEDGVIEFQPSDVAADPLLFSKAIRLSKNDISINISKGQTRVRVKNGNEVETDQRCAVGLITAMIDKTNSADAAAALAEFMEELGIQNCFGEPTKEDERKYKLARYAWHHKQSLDALTEEEAASINERLVRTEVMDGYATYVEPSKHKEYMQQAGNICVYHELSIPTEETANLFTSSGLLCSRKRFEGGKISSQGLSTQTDLGTGGGDSIFTRVITETGLTAKPSNDYSISTPTVLFHPSVLDRTDWYAYELDTYGTTDPEFFETRLPPTTLFNQHAQGDFGPGNEQMFRHGMASKDMAAIMVSGETKEHLNAVLLIADKGLTSIGEKGFDELIFMDREELVAHYKLHKKVLQMTDEQIEAQVKQDSRDKIIASCKRDKVSTVNGQSIYMFLRYGAQLSDQIEAVAQQNWHETSYIKSWRELFLRTAEESTNSLNPTNEEALYA